MISEVRERTLEPLPHDPPTRLGTPAVAGVLILAALGALVLRSHTFLRMRVTAAAAQKAAEADTVGTSTSCSSR